MIEKLSEEERVALVEYRLDRAESTLVEADYNADGGYYNSAVNRLYYAAYYATSALRAYRQECKVFLRNLDRGDSSVSALIDQPVLIMVCRLCLRS